MSGAARPRRAGLRPGERRLLLLLGDLAAAAGGAALALSLWGRFDYLVTEAGVGLLEFVQARAPWFVFLPIVWPVFLANLYDVHRAASWKETLRGVLIAGGLAVTAYLAVYFLQEGSLARRGILYFLAATVVLTLLWRAIYIRIFTAPAFLRRVLIVGAGEGGRTLLRVFNNLWPKPFFLVGLIDDDPERLGKITEAAQVLGDSTRMLDLIAELGVSDIIVAIQGPMNGEMFQALLDAQERGVEIARMPAVYEELLGRVPIRHLESDWMLRSFVDELRVSSFYLLAKRLVDMAGGLLGLLATAAVSGPVALAILLESGRPVLFRQTRLGQGGRVYKVVKFRTMRQDAESDGQAHWAKEGDPRTTRVGALLRRMHIDEFPQFWNVLRGEMSLVGPRPERPELVAELEKVIPFYRARLLVQPGLSGWAQVNYGKGASLDGSAEKLEYDLYYIKHRSLMLDAWIVLRTLGSVFGLRGV